MNILLDKSSRQPTVHRILQSQEVAPKGPLRISPLGIASNILAQNLPGRGLGDQCEMEMARSNRCDC